MELDMTKGSPSKLITKFIIPIIIGNIFLDAKIEFTTIIGVILAMIAIYILNNLIFF